MLKKLSKQLSGEDWAWNNLNTLCWAIGSISGSMAEEQVCVALVSSRRIVFLSFLNVSGCLLPFLVVGKPIFGDGDS